MIKPVEHVNGHPVQPSPATPGPSRRRRAVHPELAAKHTAERHNAAPEQGAEVAPPSPAVEPPWRGLRGPKIALERARGAAAAAEALGSAGGRALAKTSAGPANVSERSRRDLSRHDATIEK